MTLIGLKGKSFLIFFKTGQRRQKYSWVLCEHSLGCTISEQSLIYLDWLFGGSRKTNNMGIPLKRACFCDTSSSSQIFDSFRIENFCPSIVLIFTSRMLLYIHLNWNRNSKYPNEYCIIELWIVITALRSINSGNNHR